MIPNPLKLLAKTGMIGAPTFEFVLHIGPKQHITGSATANYPYLPPMGGTHHFLVSGSEHETGFGPNHHLIYVQGSYSVPFLPPAIGELTVKVTASFTLETDWSKGSGFVTVNGHAYHVTVAKE
jgi:hypothetical protein